MLLIVDSNASHSQSLFLSTLSRETTKINESYPPQIYAKFETTHTIQQCSTLYILLKCPHPFNQSTNNSKCMCKKTISNYRKFRYFGLNNKRK